MIQTVSCSYAFRTRLGVTLVLESPYQTFQIIFLRPIFGKNKRIDIRPLNIAYFELVKGTEEGIIISPTTSQLENTNQHECIVYCLRNYHNLVSVSAHSQGNTKVFRSPIFNKRLKQAS